MTSCFVDLCNAFCEVAGLAAVPPERDEEGALAASFMLNEVEVQLLSQHETAGCFFSRVILQPVQPPDDSQQWGDLLEANFVMAGVAGPVYAREPGTAEVVIQQTWPAGTAVQDLYFTLSGQCKSVRNNMP